MTLFEAMSTRHTVRKYMDKPLTQEHIDAINTRTEHHNKTYNLSMKLLTNDTRAFGTVTKFLMAKTVKNTIILSGKDASNLDEKLGYSGADIILYAQSLGLNTWWIGETFNKKSTPTLVNGDTVIGVIALGYGVNQGVPHKSKPTEAISHYEGQPPAWFNQGIEAALLAPTARNKQAFFITGKENKVSITCDNGVYTGADLGIVKYHFELGAGTTNFEWTDK
ncbi:nitroreductase [Erysipelothrix larvae]|uniref:Nitroreductase n=1 Tax=Erysipelothrix larvae TaxID=1514105 RepID=A0A0X8H098_9FIRM|nr:nitroreductase family protein [Erysipelothrix larvae]AMC93634.1 nitroreductase [Erysipelothrix larvae]